MHSQGWIQKPMMGVWGGETSITHVQVLYHLTSYVCGAFCVPHAFRDAHWVISFEINANVVSPYTKAKLLHSKNPHTQSYATFLEL